ncbi:class I SAM-dependent methyltransferase [Azospirillum halopraeferens]|uniref:class I SAM-dependent methyltransferase n=1 Tax=Azospirillum halopraeferens TaxID=34010 RepID=UPI000423B04B|nr:hypothetical protein [Azospirillum halopraeferens]
MKLNLGCGGNKRDGYVNVDKFPHFTPDVVWDLERFPWPFETDGAEAVALTHVLEHLGGPPDVFIGVMKELHRVCRAGARIEIVVPHPRSDSFISDPTHVRPVTLETLFLFNKDWNRAVLAEGKANTPLGLYHDVDFAVTRVDHRLTPRWAERLTSGRVSQEELRDAMDTYNNVIEETLYVLEVRK